MENTQAETACNLRSSSTTSISSTDTNELTKEKEDELLFGGEEEGDDEDTLSDDSLRLRLSDDEDAEQEDATTHVNISEFQSQDKTTEQSSTNGNTEETIRPNEITEDTEKTGAEESAEKENETAVKENAVPENSTLLSDGSTSEIELIQDNTEKSEIKNTIAISPENALPCSPKSTKELSIKEIANACSDASDEKRINLENDQLSMKVLPNKSSSREEPSHVENHVKEVVSDCKETNSTSVCTLNESDNAKSDSPVPGPVTVAICNSEKSPVTANSCDSKNDNFIDKTVAKTVTNDDEHRPTEHSKVTTINDKRDSADLKKSNSTNDTMSHLQDSTNHKMKIENPEGENVTRNKDAPESAQRETSTSSVQKQNNLPSVKSGITSADTDDFVIEVIENHKKSMLQTILLTTDVKAPADENDAKTESQRSYTDMNSTRRRSKRINAVQECVIEEEKQQDGRESGRQKRRTAKNAEEIIRNKYLNSDSEFSDSAEELVTVNHKLDVNVRPASPPSLKRSSLESEICNGNVKKQKLSSNSEDGDDIGKLAFVEKFFQRNVKEKLPKLTQQELEELLIQKIAETITMRSEIGQLREQARISERNQEITRTKLQQLIKQVKDFEMVLSRNALDRRTNSDKPVAPIKINRSVGLQVNFITEHGIQNLRQVQQTAYVKSSVPASVPTTSALPESSSSAGNLRRGGIKVRSPRPVITVSAPTISQSPMQTAPLISTVTPAALVVAKPLESSQHTLTLNNQSTGVQPILPVPSQSMQPIVINGKIPNQVNQMNRQSATLIAPKTRKSDLIDLTDEEEKSKSNMKVATVTTTPVLEQKLNATSKPTQAYQRVIQTIPANVAITQQAGLKVISSNQPASTAIVNNINPPRLAYVMQGTVGPPRQVLITSNTNQQIRPVTSCNRPSFSTVAYKTAGISTIANGTVRVLTTPSIQINKHPAPLPDTPTYAATSGWKLPPPAPSLKISKVSNGIVLSWNMNLSDKYADIASYQLYAYQEMVGMNPSTSLWKKVGDVRALPLPMACTLTQFSEGNNYHFAVRAVDTHSRKGQYSIPGNISL